MKMKKLLVLFLALCLVGCASEKEIKTSYCKRLTNVPNGFEVDEDYQFEYQGDQVTKQTITLSTTFTSDIYLDNGVLSETAKTLLQDGIDGVVKTLENAKGIVYKYEMKDTQVIEIYEIDYSKVTNDELMSVGLLSEADADASFVSMKKTIENLENGQFTCTMN